ncbi:MAG: hypothetical protein ACYSWU_08515 [Planctomycetota bacterium]|jgi:hypothetical protein
MDDFGPPMWRFMTMLENAYRVVLALLLMLLLGVLAMRGSRPWSEANPVPSGNPDTSSEKDPPESGKANVSEAVAAVDDAVLYDSGWEEDNSSCLVCHIDFETEKISSIHLEAELTCMACHGDSDAHRSDEFNIVRPDVIWGRTEQEAFCKQCHEKHKYPEKVEAFHEEWDSRRRPNGRYVAPDSACMDCHGDHAVMLPEGQFK